MGDQCDECVASTTEWTCEELFHELLALDHQRLQPWGSFHGVVVACYLLQHPSTAKAQQQGARLELVSVFCESGLDGFSRLANAARERNSHRAPRPEPADDPVPPAGRVFGTTIHDVAIDGTFPADGYAERVEKWAHAVRAAWTSQDR